MASDAQVLDRARRIPKTARAVATVEAIFEATARILQAEGRGGLNTNRIAEVAGVSIGSLYAYFPDKDAILLAMAERELDVLHRAVADALTGDGEPGASPIRLAVRALIRGYGARNRSRRILMETLIAHGGSDLIARPAQRLAATLAESGQGLLPPGVAMPSPMRFFILIRAVDGVVRQATYEDAPFNTSREFEDELVRLIEAYLLAPT